MSLSLPVYNQQGEEIDTMELNPSLFDVAIKPWLIQEMVIAQQSAQRKPIAHTKDRGEVRGGGKKPWKQKGTGRARHGSIRSPLWRGGGVVFGPKGTENFLKKANKKIKRQALLMALTQKVKDKTLKIVDAITLSEIKTKQIAKMLQSFNIYDKKILMALDKDKTHGAVIKSARNIPTVKLIAVDSLNTRDVLGADIVLTTREGIKTVEQTYGNRQ